MKTLLKSFARTTTAGFLAVLPVVLSVAVIVWLAGFVVEFIGPESITGRLISKIGLTIVPDSATAYGIGIVAVIVLLYAIGLVVLSTLEVHFKALLDNTVGRIPLLGKLYNLANRFVAMFDQKEEVDMKAMSPVWCHFGGKTGAAVLALMPTSQPVHLGDTAYCGILVPTAPIPIGGGLVFVPTDWVEPADFGVEALTQIYVSMGLAAPQYQAKGT